MKVKEVLALFRRVLVKRKYKDILFRFIFKDKKELLQLYNAINGTSYKNPDDLLITTMEDVIYIGMKNDLSFLININYGHNQELMEKCQRLNDYSYFVASVRNYLKEGRNQKDAVTCAVNECIEKGILKDVLEKHRAEVADMFLTTFDKKMYEEALREEGREEMEEKYAELSKDHAELSKDHAELSKDHAELSRDHAELSKQLEEERKRVAELEALLAEKNK